jgi:hypothetical protein
MSGVKQLVFPERKRCNMASPRTLKDLKDDPLNPRRITTKQKEQLLKSYVEFGDLSGIIWNVRTQHIVGGHQRTNVLNKKSTEIKSEPHKDPTGTVAIGWVIVPRADGGKTRIPYREVDWDLKRQRAANIAANSAGGQFDEVKLGRILTELKAGRFPIENIPIDTLDLKKACKAFESENKRRSGIDGEGGEFAAVDPRELQEEAQHQCPKCSYMWSGSTKPSFGELHRLTDDNPSKILARKLQKKIVARKEKAKLEAAKSAKSKKSKRG